MIKKLAVSVLVLLSLTACSPENAGDPFVPAYTGWAKVESATPQEDSCVLGIFMFRNGLKGHLSVKGPCTAAKGEMFYMMFGQKI